MDARERILTLLSGEEPDRVPVLAADTVRVGPPGGWVPRLTARGLVLLRRICPYRPHWNFPAAFQTFLPGIRCTSTYYLDGGRMKICFTLETPAGEVSSVIAVKLTGTLAAYAREEPFIKQRSDWRPFTHLFQVLTRVLSPNYDEFIREQETLGGRGFVLGYLTKSSFPRAWVQLASPEQAVLDFKQMPAELEEFLEAERAFHHKAAEIAAGSPAQVLNLYDNITDMVSPALFERFCVPTYQIYADALRGTGKLLACHMDGRLGHLRQPIARSPIQLIESLTVPPVGNLPLSEVRAAWKDKIIWINCPPHLTYVPLDRIRQGYQEILDEWGDRRLAIEYVEDLPDAEMEPHLGVVLDLCGYPS
jgi:hypothetical protein